MTNRAWRYALGVQDEDADDDRRLLQVDPPLPAQADAAEVDVV